MKKSYDLSLIDSDGLAAANFVEKLGLFYHHYKTGDLYQTTGFSFDAERDLWQIQYVASPNGIPNFAMPTFARALANFFQSIAIPRSDDPADFDTVPRFALDNTVSMPEVYRVELNNEQPSAEMWAIAKAIAVSFGKEYPTLTFASSVYSANMIAYAILEHKILMEQLTER